MFWICVFAVIMELVFIAQNHNLKQDQESDSISVHPHFDLLNPATGSKTGDRWNPKAGQRKLASGVTFLVRNMKDGTFLSFTAGALVGCTFSITDVSSVPSSHPETDWFQYEDSTKTKFRSQLWLVIKRGKAIHFDQHLDVHRKNDFSGRTTFLEPARLNEASQWKWRGKTINLDLLNSEYTSTDYSWKNPTGDSWKTFELSENTSPGSLNQDSAAIDQPVEFFGADRPTYNDKMNQPRPAEYSLSDSPTEILPLLSDISTNELAQREISGPQYPSVLSQQTPEPFQAESITLNHYPFMDNQDSFQWQRSNEYLEQVAQPNDYLNTQRLDDYPPSPPSSNYLPEQMSSEGFSNSQDEVAPTTDISNADSSSTKSRSRHKVHHKTTPHDDDDEGDDNEDDDYELERRRRKHHRKDRNDDFKYRNRYSSERLKKRYAQQPCSLRDIRIQWTRKWGIVHINRDTLSDAQYHIRDLSGYCLHTGGKFSERVSERTGFPSECSWNFYPVTFPSSSI